MEICDLKMHPNTSVSVVNGHCYKFHTALYSYASYVLMHTAAALTGGSLREQNLRLRECAPVTAAVVNDAWCVSRVHHSTGQCSCTPGMQHSATFRASNTCFHSTGSVAAKQSRPQSSWLQNGAISSSECISHGCTTLTKSSSVLCTFGMASTRPSLTMQLTSGVAVFVIVYGLSLIHIWRCRRSTLCRSRWSPYH